MTCEFGGEKNLHNKIQHPTVTCNTGEQLPGTTSDVPVTKRQKDQDF